ncbi:Calcium uniporter protein, mitochondrial [Hondaea fermentalgiana]|uniref:Calcium uniporter protein, mitochondrial n=1 Tax=Hondaea fermentalgiana TaxID=2315210 RepID=A0A2R5GJK2_9STRA|nr:Calcium uniporter protein, mitochondrial [Hondaea fermentalgiana]|eukprot:GBG31057.1 Calcium uniporter protein, mitochondrial [Hondaea fermentalgiana]
MALGLRRFALTWPRLQASARPGAVETRGLHRGCVRATPQQIAGIRWLSATSTILHDDLHKPRVSFLDLEDPAYDEFELRLPVAEKTSTHASKKDATPASNLVLVEAQETVQAFQRRANVRVLDPEGFPVGPYVRMQTLLLLPSGGGARFREMDDMPNIQDAASDTGATEIGQSEPKKTHEACSDSQPETLSLALQLESLADPSKTVRIAHLRAEDLLEAAAANAWAGKSHDLASARAEVADIEERLENLEARKRRLDGEALQSCKRRWWAAFVFLSAQNLVLAYGVWGVYSWDVMEPITYFIGSSVTLWGAFYFAWLRRENSYDTLFNNMLARRRASLHRQDGFDESQVIALRRLYRRALQHRDHVELTAAPSSTPSPH